MTPKVLRPLVFALSIAAWNAIHAQAAEPFAVPPAPASAHAGDPGPAFQEPLPLEAAFGTAAPPLLPAVPLPADPASASPPVAVDEAEKPEGDLFGRPYNAPGWYSRPEWDALNWRSGNNGRFGEFSFEGVGAYPFKTWEGLSFTSGGGYHFLNGPTQSDMPPRLFEFNWGLHYFGETSDGVWLDMGFSVGIYTDFEDSVREGWRFPTHAVFSWESAPGIQPVLGLRFFDRDNLGLLPVAGVILQPEDGLRFELIFPEPKVAFRVSESTKNEHWLSLSGRIGGGEWAIEREPSGLADVVNYNDYQLVFGLESINEKFEINALEIGYSFNRELKYRSGAGSFDPAETIFVRLVTRR